MKHPLRRILVILFCAVLIGAAFRLPDLFAREWFSQFAYITDHEYTSRGELIWFWTVDTIYGPVHSNDYIGIKGRPVFYGQLSTARNRFIELNANPYFESEPQFGVPIRDFPTTARDIRDNADPIIDSDDGQLMTAIDLIGDDGIKIYQWRNGIPREDHDSLIMTLDPPDGQAIFVTGEAEVKGLLSGVLTIGTQGDMWLVDDIRYNGADERNGHFDPDSMEHLLGLVSERNIIIKDNVANGRANGWQGGGAPGQTDRNSIIINGALFAMGESFTFEHQNEDGDAYQGPTPDERGIIHLIGGVAQKRRGYLHIRNHLGTGYGWDRHFDTRLLERIPPYFPAVESYSLSGEGNTVTLDLVYSPLDVIGSGGYDTLIVPAGFEFVMGDSGALNAKYILELNGTEEAPIQITSQDAGARGLDWGVYGDQRLRLTMKHTNLGVGVNFQFAGRSAEIDGATFSDESDIGGWTCLVKNSQFDATAVQSSDSGFVIDSRYSSLFSVTGIENLISGCTFENSVSVSPIRRAHFADCTFESSVFVASGYVTFSSCNFNSDLATSSSVDSLRLHDCMFADDVWLDPDVYVEMVGCQFDSTLALYVGQNSAALISGSTFAREVTVNCGNHATLFGNVFRRGLQYVAENGQPILTVVNNTILGGDAALAISCGFEAPVPELDVRNNIFAYSQVGVVFPDGIAGDTTSIVDYNCFWANDSADFTGIENAGDNSIFDDPLFLDYASGDFSLRPESPCIDSGDPNSPYDPDSSRADIGAIPYVHPNSAPASDFILHPSSFILVGAFPNPFNGTVELRVEVAVGSVGNVALFDLQGRRLFDRPVNLTAGRNSIKLSAAQFPAAGLYIARVTAASNSATTKLIFLP